MSDRPHVALLYQSESSARHVRDTLAALGTPIAYDAAAKSLDREALSRSQASVVVVNLEDEDDPALDDVYALLDDPRYRVVFNDSGVSSELSGWDHARWVRHLAAKILGDADIDPPRPADAEPVPVRPRAASTPPVAATAAAAPVAVHVESAAPQAEIESAAPQAESSPAPAPGASAPADPLAVPAPAGFDPTEFLDLLGEAPAGDAFGPRAGAKELPPVEIEVGAEGMELESIDELLSDFDVRTPEPLVEPEVADEFALDAVAPEDVPVAAGIRPADADDPSTVPAAVDVFELDFDLDDAVAAEATPQPASTQAERTIGALAETWSLEDVDAPPPPPTGPANFGIEKLTAAEYLAPEADEAQAQVPVPELSELSLELIPIEEAVSPTREPMPDHENWFDPDAVKAKIQRIWVLGASVGGPESVREFLAGLPRDYPALFLLAQHLGDEFVDMMAKQLAKATPLTVRTPSHGERVSHGDIVIVPTSQRLQVDPAGVVLLEKSASETEYRPSIDRVLEDVANRYGATAGAIIFSGMSDDAVAGCRQLVEKGGRVYAQSPDTCVVATMVEGVVEAGVVSFVGSPKELSARLMAERDGK